MKDKISRWWDSYCHYRDDVKLPFIHAIYRAFYYEIKHKEPWA